MPAKTVVMTVSRNSPPCSRHSRADSQGFPKVGTVLIDSSIVLYDYPNPENVYCRKRGGHEGPPLQLTSDVYEALKLVVVIVDRIVDLDVAAVVRLQFLTRLEANRLA